MLLLLITVLFLPDLVSPCPAHDNPLALDPSEVTIPYGTDLWVNCTTTNDDFKEMYWSDGTGERVTEDEMTFISWPVSASDWDMKASCAIKLNDSYECSKDLKITVYKRADRVYLHPVKALVEGRQHQLHCDIINVAPVQNLTVRWYKDDVMVKTESFTQTTKTPVNESSTLPVTVRRDDREVLFVCEARLDFDSGSLVRSDPLLVPVHYAPDLNSITNQVLFVDEGDDVTLICEIDANPPPEYHWTSDRGNVLDNTNNLTLTNILVSADYNCTAANYLGSKTRQIHVYVINVVTATPASAPVDDIDCSPTLTPSELVVRFGDPVSIDCNVSVSNFQGMGWEATTGGTGMLVSSYSSWRVDKLDVWDPKPSCFVSLLNERQCVSEASITVYKRADRVYLHPVEALVEGRQHQLHCDIINVAPVQNLTVRWYKDDVMVKTESFTQTTKTPVNESSTLPVTVRRDDREVLFVCEARLDFDSGSLVRSDPLLVPVHYAPELNNITNQVLFVDEGDDVTLICEIDANPPPEYHWTSDRGNVLDNTNNLTLTNILVSADYNCTAANYLGSKTRQIHVYVINVVTATPASAPVDDIDCSPTLTPSELVVRFGDPVSIDCNVSVSNFQGMGWEATTGGTGMLVSSYSSWRVDKLDVWDPKPSCFVSLLNERQCVSEASITVYKRADRVYLHPVEALVEGRQHQLHCDIINVAPVQNLTVRWYKDDVMVKTESFTQTTKTPVNESSTLPVTVRRDDREVLFVCEARLDFDSGSLVRSDPLLVPVHYAPELNNITNQVFYVDEGDDVTLICEIDANPPPEYHWTSDRGNVLDNTNNLTLTNILVSADYNCTATNYLGNKTRQIHVYVINIVTATPASAPVDDTDCSPTLTPSELVVRFGDPVSIDCNVSVSNFQGMGWEATTGGTGMLVSPYSSWRVDKLDVWDPKPSCFVSLLNGRQCVSEPSITVYKRADRVYLHPVEALVEGRQHQLHCDIINVAPVQNLTVRWYKDDVMVKTESFTQTTKTPVNESSTLPVTVRRDDREVLFVCEARLDFDSGSLVRSDPLLVPVHYAPELNNITNQVLFVDEGDDVTLICEIDANPPPEYHWTSDRGNVLDNTNNLTLTNILVSADYNCTAANYLGNKTRQIHIYVINIVTATPASAPVDDIDCSPTLTPSELVVRFGDPVSIDCNISVSNFQGMGWEATTGGTGMLVSPYSSWRVDKLDVWDPKPSCFVSLLNGRRCVSEASVTVYKTPDRVSVSPLSHQPMVEGTEYLLKCVIIDVAPVQNLTVRWYRGSELLHTEMFNDESGNAPKTPQNQTFVLRVAPERGHSGAQFQCEAEQHLGPQVPKPLTTKSEPYIAVVHVAPTFTQGNGSEEISLGEDVTFGCHAEGNPHPTIHWVYSAADNVREATWGRQRNITIQQATSTNAGQYICVARNDVGAVTRLVTVTVKDKAAQSGLGFSWWYLPLIIISVVIVLFAITVLHCHKKHGRYSFITVRTNEDIPLGTKSAAGGIY